MPCVAWSKCKVTAKTSSTLQVPASAHLIREAPALSGSASIVETPLEMPPTAAAMAGDPRGATLLKLWKAKAQPLQKWELWDGERCPVQELSWWKFENFLHENDVAGLLGPRRDGYCDFYAGYANATWDVIKENEFSDEVLCEGYHGPWKHAYHGTWLYALPAILRHGLRGSHDTSAGHVYLKNMPGVYASDRFQTAAAYGVPQRILPPETENNFSSEPYIKVVLHILANTEKLVGTKNSEGGQLVFAEDGVRVAAVHVTNGKSVAKGTKHLRCLDWALVACV